MESVDDLNFLKCHFCMTKGQLDKGKGGGGGGGNDQLTNSPPNPNNNHSLS